MELKDANDLLTPGYLDLESGYLDAMPDVMPLAPIDP